VLLARLLASPDPKTPEASVARELGRLQLFAGTSSWTFLVWEDLGVRLALAADPSQPLAADVADAGATGLYAVQLPPGGSPPLQVRHQGHTLGRSVKFERITVHFDGKSFRVERTSGQIDAGEAAAG
ncbi:MAG TPA: hypothetical protein VIK91_25425, partial [Nannocystis sp.]